MIDRLKKQIFSDYVKHNFNEVCLEVFRYQAQNIEVYKKYLHMLGIEPNAVKQINEIPFLPIEFFKSQTVLHANGKPQKIFESSGTTGLNTSRHHVADIEIYKESFLKAFNLFYGQPTQWCVIGLLPSYIERENSSLVFMVDELIKQSQHPLSGFHLLDYNALSEKLISLQHSKQKVWLIGVTYALLDFAEKHSMPLVNTVVLETGGMKGKRPDMLREEVHRILCEKFAIDKIHSEYGMTELLSQAYSNGDGIFFTPPWMKVLIRDVNDPFAVIGKNKTGGINVIDLANLNSCSFIATQDLGKVYADGSFEVLGRFDNADVRGCNLLVV